MRAAGICDMRTSAAASGASSSLRRTFEAARKGGVAWGCALGQPNSLKRLPVIAAALLAAGVPAACASGSLSNNAGQHYLLLMTDLHISNAVRTSTPSGT